MESGEFEDGRAGVAGSVDRSPDELVTLRERAAASREGAVESRERAAAGREQAVDVRERVAQQREEAVLDREEAADRRDAQALGRDRSAKHRDDVAAERDAAAQTRDRLAVSHDAELSDRVSPQVFDVLREDRLGARSDRARAAEDRRFSAEDRSHAHADRVAAAHDRKMATEERASTLFDELTGVLRRGPGFHELNREMARARRSSEGLVLGFVDVVGLKFINDSHGHRAGDDLLRRVADALRTNLRPYDPILRYGGDEFICALVGLSLAEARTRLAAINVALASDDDASVTIGLAELQADDSLETLIDRADADLYRQRHHDDRRASSGPGGNRS